MPDKVQLIKEEIEKCFNDNMKASEQYTEKSKSRALFTSAAKEDYDLLAFIDSLPEEPKCIYNRTFEERKETCKYCTAACSVRIEEEPASKDLEEEIDEEIDNLCELGCYMEDLAKGNSEGVYPLPDNVVKELRKFARHFAEWQKQQMMKDALNCSIIMHPNDRLANYSISAYVPPLHPASTYISNGDKVKIIVIKED